MNLDLASCTCIRTVSRWRCRLHHFHAGDTAIRSFHDGGLASLDQNVYGGAKNCRMEVFKLLASWMISFNELIKR